MVPKWIESILKAQTAFIELQVPRTYHSAEHLHIQKMFAELYRIDVGRNNTPCYRQCRQEAQYVFT